MSKLELPSLWKALAESKRRRIIQLLYEQARTTSDISSHFDVSRFAIMRHLKVLEQAGLIKTRREGRQRWNYLNEDLFQQIQQKYLEGNNGARYQLGDIFTFLAQEEVGRGSIISSSAQQPIQLEVELPAGSGKVYQALTEEIDNWWSYRILDESRMHLEPFAGGRLYEGFENGGGALYAIVTYLRPGEEIRLSGSMGLADEGANNVIHISLQSMAPEATLLRLTHRFVGQVSDITVETFKRSWVELLTQYLSAFVTSGIGYQTPF